PKYIAINEDGFSSSFEVILGFVKHIISEEKFKTLEFEREANIPNLLYTNPKCTKILSKNIVDFKINDNKKFIGYMEVKKDNALVELCFKNSHNGPDSILSQCISYLLWSNKHCLPIFTGNAL